MRSRRCLAAFTLLTALAAGAPLVHAEIVAPARRDVTPPGVTPGPRGDGPLTREPVPPRPPDPPRWRRFFLPRTVDAATFVVGERQIRVSGVAAPAADAECRGSEAAVWPCGRTALHALRMFLRGRAIECFFPPADAAADVIAPCRAGKTDLGLWLLAQGWAKPGEYATDAYRAAAETARCAGRGLWRGIVADASCPANPAQGAKIPFE